MFIFVEDKYPTEFERKVITPIFQLMYHVFAHIYEFHYDRITELGEEPHLNALMSHFICFGRSFKLFPSVDVEPMAALVNRIFPFQPESEENLELDVRRPSQSKEET